MRRLIKYYYYWHFVAFGLLGLFFSLFDGLAAAAVVVVSYCCCCCSVGASSASEFVVVLAAVISAHTLACVFVYNPRAAYVDIFSTHCTRFFTQNLFI